MSRVLVAPGRDTDLVGLELLELTADEKLVPADDREVAVVVLSGTLDVTVDGVSLGLAGGRNSVFEGPGHAVYAPPGSRLRLRSEGRAELIVASAPLDGRRPAPARVIAPAEQRVAEVGRDNWRRSVRTILGPEQAAGRLLLGETVNPPGCWSSYPPHKHDQQRPPTEVQLEEVYFYRVDPPAGFGVQVRYGPGGSDAFVVRDKDVAIIRSGYHPVAAAPGYSLYYLWVMAGEGREMIPYLDPVHAWVAMEGRGR